MVSQNNQPEPVRTAADIAAVLNRPTTGKAVMRLAEAISDPKIKPAHPAETPMRIALLQLQGSTRALSCKIEADLRSDGRVKWWAWASYKGEDSIGCFGDTITEAVNGVVSKYNAESTARTRRATIAARIEREMAEADAAEKALKHTAPLVFRPDESALVFVPDGSGADSLPMIASTVSTDLARQQELRDIERIDERDAAKEEAERFDGVPADTDGGAA